MSSIADHLWQSTLFALAAGLLTLTLRKNGANCRYWVWFAASLKFLLPFSLLAGIGGNLTWSPSAAGPQGWLYPLFIEISQPFTRLIVPRGSGILAAIVTSREISSVPTLLAAVWLCGFGMVLSTWFSSWRRISAAMREAVPLHEGREVQALRRIERIAGICRPIAMARSAGCLEPGIFGILAPVLLWPEGISAQFEDAHLEAVLTHEVWHVRRRDNLAAALHMIVEAACWFHPLVWWLGTRLVYERERACDEKVLELGSERRIYAEGILRTCEFCTRLPLACQSGVTGADLEKRIVGIMTRDVSHRPGSGRKLLLGTAGLAVITVPIVLGSLNAAPVRALIQTKNPDGSSSGLAALHANRDTPANTSMLRLLKAGSVVGAACPNSVASSVPLRGDLGKL
jgi:bla regulator protein blaR1